MSSQRRASAFDLARRAGARYVGVNGADSAGLEEYMASGTYTPTVTTNGSATVALVLSAGYSRVGNGAGVPSAGDTVEVWGALDAFSLVNGEIVSVSLPFEVATTVPPWASVPRIANGSSDLVGRCDVATITTLEITFTVATDDSEIVYFHAIYQTANAVDP